MRLAHILGFTVAVLGVFQGVHSQCDYGTPDGTYRAMWIFEQSNSFIKFVLQVNQRTRKNFWTGIGFGTEMRAADIILVTVMDDNITVTDRHSTSNVEPVVDKHQDIHSVVTKLTDGIVYVEFTRPVNTFDKEDLPLMDREKGFCQDFMFPLSAGVAVEEAGSIVLRKHFQIPVVRRMCNIDQCSLARFNSEPTEAGTTPKEVAITNAGATQPRILPSAPPASQAPIPTFTIPPDVTRLLPAPTQSSASGNDIQERTRSPPADQDGFNSISNAAPALPATCSFSDNEYDIKWTYNSTSKSVAFALDTSLSLGRWTAVGFGRTMQPGDMFIFYDARGVVEISDRHSNGRAEPVLDAHQDIEVQSIRYNGDRLQAEFSRKVNTGDAEDIPLEDPSLNGCQYFMFPLTGGPMVPNLNGSKPRLGIHTTRPVVNLVCGISRCVPGSPETVVVNGQPPQVPRLNVPQGNAIQTPPTLEQLARVTQTFEQPARFNQKFVEASSGRPEPPQGSNLVGFTQFDTNRNAEVFTAPPLEQRGLNGESRILDLNRNQGRIAEEANLSGFTDAGSRISVPPLPSGPSQTQGVDFESRKPCLPREDNEACKVYIDDYMALVFAQFPRIDQIVQKACLVLSEHQDGAVYSECCKYLRQTCKGFI